MISLIRNGARCGPTKDSRLLSGKCLALSLESVQKKSFLMSISFWFSWTASRNLRMMYMRLDWFSCVNDRAKKESSSSGLKPTVTLCRMEYFEMLFAQGPSFIAVGTLERE